MATEDTALMAEGKRIADEMKEVFRARVWSTGGFEGLVSPEFVPFAANTINNVARTAAQLAAPGPLKDWLQRVAREAAEVHEAARRPGGA